MQLDAIGVCVCVFGGGLLHLILQKQTSILHHFANNFYNYNFYPLLPSFHPRRMRRTGGHHQRQRPALQDGTIQGRQGDAKAATPGGRLLTPSARNTQAIGVEEGHPMIIAITVIVVNSG